MPLRKVDELPNELLISICSYLSGHNRQELYAFGLVNKKCRAAAVIWIFQKIHVRPTGYSELTPVVRQWMHILDRNSAWTYIHTIKVSFAWQWQDNVDMSRQDLPFQASVPVRVHWDDKSQLESVVSNTIKRRRLRLTSYTLSQRESERAWSLFILLFEQAPSLTNLVWNCRLQLPRVVFRCLTQAHPRCKLTIKNLSLHSSKTYDSFFAYLNELMTSPLLHKITIDAPNQLRGRHTGAISRIASMAPNLRELTVCLSLADIEEPPLFPRSQETAQIPDQHRLEKVTFAGNGRGDDARMMICETIRTKHLKELVLDLELDEYSYNWIASNCHFSSLKKFDVKFYTESFRGNRRTFEIAGRNLIQSLPGLESLHISGVISDELMEAILQVHSSTLQELRVDAFQPTSSFAQLKVPRLIPGSFMESLYRFHKLERLRIPVAWSRSHSVFEKFSQAIAKAPRLRHLTILLECYSVAKLGNDRSPFWNTYVKEVFDDADIDTTLVCSVWSMISTARDGHPLQSLRLRPILKGIVKSPSGIDHEIKRMSALSKQYTLTATGDNEVEKESIKQTKMKKLLVKRKRLTYRRLESMELSTSLKQPEGTWSITNVLKGEGLNIRL